MLTTHTRRSVQKHMFVRMVDITHTLVNCTDQTHVRRILLLTQLHQPLISYTMHPSAAYPSFRFTEAYLFQRPPSPPPPKKKMRFADGNLATARGSHVGHIKGMGPDFVSHNYPVL